MTTRANVSRRLTARLRAIVGRSDRRSRNDGRRSRVSTVSFERSHRDTVWIPPDPPLGWFRAQGSEPMPTDGGMRRRWFS